MNELYTSLMQLQDLDLEIEAAENRVKAFGPKLDQLRTPVTTLEREVEQVNTKLEELRKQQRKLDHGLNNKRDRLRIFEEKAAKAKQRDESELRADADFIKRAVEAEEAESNEVNDAVRRHDMRLDDLGKSIAKATEEIQPAVDELTAEKQAAEQDLAVLKDKRANAAQRLDKNTVRVYERVRSGKRKVALAPLTAQGACGSCFNVLPLQEQAEIRKGSGLRRCEACGVILYPVSDTE